MKYFKRFWDEDCDGRGTSTWFFETDASGEVLKQIEVYENGLNLKYSQDFIEDENGGLSTVALDLDDFHSFKITKEAFYKVWE